MLLAFILAIGNVWGADLTAHAPGVYEKTVAEGGYGCTLTTVATGENAGVFEVYYFSANSKYGNTTDVYGGGEKQQYRLMCADNNSEYQLINTNGTSAFTKSCDWIEMAHGTTGFAKSDYTYGTNTFNEFFAITPNGGNTSNTKTCYVKPKEGDVLTLKVSGYVEFAILGADNSSSKYMTITVDHGTPTSWNSNTLSRRSVELTTGEHTIVVANVGSSANNFYGFSLKLPSCDATVPGNISKGALNAGTLTLNAAGYGSKPATDEWYWQTAADGVDKSNSGASFDVTAVGTYYVRSLYNGDCWSAAKSFEVKATDLVENYTVIYKDGETELQRVPVEVGHIPDAYAPTKDCYTFANWDVDPSTLGSTAANAEVTLTAVWTPRYASSFDFGATTDLTKSNIVSKLDAVNIACTVGTGGSYDNGATNGYLGYKFKNKNDKVVFLLKQGWQATITYGYTESGWTVNGTDAGVATATKAYVDKVYTATSGDVLYTLVNQSADSKTSVLTKIVISQLYDATLNDTKSDGSDSKTSVAEVTLPTPTAVSGWTYTGWIANQDVKDSEDNTKTAGTILSAGTYTLLANTTFTAQWVEASATYDITYSSAHGTAPVAANAASVVLTELSAEGWAHKGWTADKDVTVDAATVTAGTIIANGKTAILASDVTFTAVWTEIFTVTYKANGGTCGTASATWTEGDEALVLPTATKENYDFIGWYDAATGGNKIASPYTPTASIELFAHYMPKLIQAIYSNSFDAFIKNQAVNVYYLQGESEPTLSSIKVLGVETPVFEEADGNIKVTIETVDYIFPVTKTAVAPYAGTGSKETFDGTETYVKTGYSYSDGWRFSKTDDNWSRETPGNTRLYFFLGAADHFTLESTGTSRAIKVYRNGVLLDVPTASGSNPTIAGSNAPAMYAIVSNQTGGDGKFTAITTSPWVPTIGVTLKEGEDAISSKTIWAGTNFTLTAIVTPDNASDKTITWTSSNDAIATVVNGVVTGVAANATPATITATTVDGVSATCVVTVTAAPAPCETPTINTQPATQAYCVGSEPTLTIDAGVTDGGTLHYAWFKDDAAIGSDAATCLVDGAGTYKVVVTNHVDGKLDASVTSDNAVITLNVAAAITTQPTNKSEIVSGSSVTLSLVATNATSYQWYSCDDAEKTNAAVISGAEAADYVFPCTANGYYYCEVGNACGDAILSNVVSVKLEPEGCNTLASIPSAEPYQYEQAGEWTLYCVSSDGTLLGSNKFTDEGKDFDGNSDVNALLDKRFAIKFAKDVESVTIYAEGGTGRTFNKVYISSEMTKNTYSELEGVTKQMVNAETNRQYILTVTGIIPADQYAWFELSGSLGVFKICYSEALAKPTIPTLSNQELCSGESYAEIDATSTKTGEGTLSYQWYDATDEEHPVVIDGANSATFTPTADGKYYVEVTNAAAGHVSNKAKSNTINVAHFAATEITTALENQRKDAGEEVTLAVVASGKNLHYAWKECATIDGTYADVAGATDAPSLTVTVTAGMDKYYKVIVSSDCGSAVESIARVEEWTELPQVDVTAATTWDMANVADVAINLKEDFNPSRQNERLLLANLKGVNNDATFNAQALMFEGQHIGRTTNSVKHLAGRYLQFNVTVPGVVFVTFASNGDNQRTIRINANKCAETTNDGAYITFAAAVNPGSVEIMGIQDESENQYVRISKVEFRTTPDYPRSVSSNIGTLCVDHNVPAGAALGATFYQLVGKEPTYGKLVFDEVTELEAGKPYIFQSTTGSIALYYGETVQATPLEVNGMVGSYTNTEVEITEENKTSVMYIASNKLWDCSDYQTFTNQKLQVVANRAYIYDYNAIGTASPNPAPGRRRITVGKDGQNAATGIGNVQGDEVQSTKVLINGQLFILRGEKLYNANGQLVK